jgi:hypothetical protein
MLGQDGGIAMCALWPSQMLDPAHSLAALTLATRCGMAPAAPSVGRQPDASQAGCGWRMRHQLLGSG